MPFIHDDFLLQTKAARRLYHEFAQPEPILDYHCHLSPKDLAENRRFANLFEIWLEGDHYKWRAMRSDGVPERFCTGDASPRDKFLAWARTVPHTLRNPLYHWSHLELARYFGITELLDERTAPAIWDRANEQLATPELSAHGILKKFSVKAIGTTDDPADSLAHHETLARSGLATKVVPTFRPDKALAVHQPVAFNAWLDRLEAASNTSIARLPDLLAALQQRHDAFHALGARCSDHGLEHAFAEPCTDAEAVAIFDQALGGTPASSVEQRKFATYIMLFVGRLNAEKGWVMQLHLGAIRNNNTRLMKSLGPDTGFDSIGDFPQVQTLAAFLDRLDQENALPRTW
jgi:glucuronate isomerase